jgi:hypothetical protein
MSWVRDPTGSNKESDAPHLGYDVELIRPFSMKAGAV